MEDRKRTILVVDDSATSLAFTAATLTGAGYTVWTCQTVFIAGQIARHRPDLVLVDFNMPNIKGDVIVRALRGKSFLGDTKLVLYSSISISDLTQKAIDCGADGAVEKTANREHLFFAVERYL